MTSPRGGRFASTIVLALLSIGLAPNAGRGQEAAEKVQLLANGADGGNGVLRCFGTSVGRDCRVMLQYELGYRVATAGRSPKLDAARQRDRSDRSQGFVAGGVFVPVSSRDALGVMFDAGAGDEAGTRALGVRWARGFAHDARIDLTAGATWLPLSGDTTFRTRGVRAQGAFVEAALHGNNLLTLVVRDEAYASRRNARGGNLVFAGARAEAVPAAVTTMLGVALVGIAMGLTGPGW